MTFPLLYLALCLPLFSWSMYVWLHYYVAMFLLMPLLIVGLVILISLVRNKRLPSPKLSVAQILFTGVLVVALTYAAPRHSYLEGKSILQSFAQGLGIDMKQLDQKIQITSSPDDIGYPRHALAVYEITESFDEAERKLRERLEIQHGWSFYETDLRVSSICGRYERDGQYVYGFGDDEVNLSKKGTLIIRVFFDSPERCRL